MITEAIFSLVRRLFIFLAVVRVLGLSFSFVANSFLDGVPPPVEAMTNNDWLIVAGMIGFVLILSALLLFMVLPVVINRVKVIWEVRQDSELEMFP